MSNEFSEFDDDEILPPDPPHWFCESCGYTKDGSEVLLVANRQKFFAAGNNCKICPRCKSETFVIVGF